MQRREFITFLGGVAIVWPLAAGAAGPAGATDRRADGIRRERSVSAIFVGNICTEPSTIGVDRWSKHFDRIRWAGGDTKRIEKFAKELVELRPDVILANTTPVTVALHRETRTIPIVFAIVSDPVGAGLVAKLSQPGGNITGFINIEALMGGKWLELLKEIAPGVRRAAIMFNPDTAPGGGSYFLPSFETAARSLGVEPITAAVRSDADIESAVTALRESDGGLVVSADGFMLVHRRSIISLTARNSVPAIFFTPAFPKDGGLLAYGANSLDVFRRAGPYVDRVLRGAKPGDLPVQVPTKFELVINLKTAKALGLTVPPTLLARADEVIE